MSLSHWQSRLNEWNLSAQARRFSRGANTPGPLARGDHCLTVALTHLGGRSGHQ